MNSALKKEIIEAEESLKLAMVSSDVDALNQLLSEELMFTNHMGQILSKSDDLAAHTKGDFKISNLSLSDQIIKRSGNVVIVSAHTKIIGSYKGETSSGNFRFTRVWEKHDSKWQVLAGHACIVA
ncbi:MAG: ketosteroid isomerase-like protein [Alteromonadaceae bacterium]